DVPWYGLSFRSSPCLRGERFQTANSTLLVASRVPLRDPFINGPRGQPLSRSSAASAYNSPMHVGHCKILSAGLLLLAICARAQQAPSPQALTVSAKELPKASLWGPYNFQLQASGGISPYRWRVISGSLPHGLR